MNSSTQLATLITPPATTVEEASPIPATTSTLTSTPLPPAIKEDSVPTPVPPVYAPPTELLAAPSFYVNLIAALSAAGGAVVSFFATVISMRNLFVGKKECALCKVATAQSHANLQQQLEDLKESNANIHTELSNQGALLHTLHGQTAIVVDYVKMKMAINRSNWGDGGR